MALDKTGNARISSLHIVIVISVSNPNKLDCFSDLIADFEKVSTFMFRKYMVYIRVIDEQN